jgi:phosphate starvation-inducible PhoH-like protein
MKMFLTRMGNGSKVVVTGDVTQVDLPSHMVCGMTDAMGRLAGIERVGIVEMTGRDIVRHRLVKEIVRAYETDAGGGRQRKR